MRRTRKDGAPSESRRAHGMTLEEIASVLGMTKQAVHDTEKRAMRKLRLAMGSTYDGPIGPFLRDVVGIEESRYQYEGRSRDEYFRRWR